MPPICIALPSWLLNLEERQIPRYTSQMYCDTPPISTAVHLPFVPVGGSGKFLSYGAHQGGRATACFLEGFLEGVLEGYLTASAS